MQWWAWRWKWEKLGEQLGLAGNERLAAAWVTGPGVSCSKEAWAQHKEGLWSYKSGAELTQKKMQDKTPKRKTQRHAMLRKRWEQSTDSERAWSRQYRCSLLFDFPCVQKNGTLYILCRKLKLRQRNIWLHHQFLLIGTSLNRLSAQVERSNSSNLIERKQTVHRVEVGNLLC